MVVKSGRLLVTIVGDAPGPEGRLVPRTPPRPQPVSGTRDPLSDTPVREVVAVVTRRPDGEGRVTDREYESPRD